MDKLPYFHYKGHLGWINGNCTQETTDSFWTLSQNLAFRVVQLSAIDIYQRFYNTLSSGRWQIPIHQSPFHQVRESYHLVEGPPPSFSPVSEETKQALLQLVLQESNSKPQLPISSPGNENLESGNGNDGLGEPEPYIQPRAPESLVPEGLVLKDGQPSLPTETVVGDSVELQPGDGGVGGRVPSPEPSASRPSGVDDDGHVDKKQKVSDTGLSLRCEISSACTVSYTNTKALHRHYRTKHPDNKDYVGSRNPGVGTLLCEISSACTKPYVSTSGRLRHYRTAHPDEYARRQATGEMRSHGH
jgi:hypothetical protein